MSFKLFDWYTWLISSFVSFFFLVILECSFFFCAGSGVTIINSYFWCDSVSFYLTMLSVLLWLSLSFFGACISGTSVVMISVSVVFSILSYSCVNSFLFWVFYELSILSLLLLIICESPYSERYVATWYLAGYVVVTSLPMLVCILYLSFDQGSFNLNEWCLGLDYDTLVFIFLSILFITKIPLLPFHVWLPIVHAEASSIVSVCLSGYVMKLGILGSFRFCSWILPSYVFSFFYSSILLIFCASFFLGACRELDGKRWLALMSLCHITIPVVCFCVGLFESSWVSFFYCLGHGLSAAVMFILLWVLYDITGSRNWFIVKVGLSGSLLFRLFTGACLCTVASLPPTINFFSEVLVVCWGGLYSVILVFLLLCYLFMGGLVPVFLLGCLLTRHYSVKIGGGFVYGGFCSISFLVFWAFFLFVVC
nr:NADH dehydrogenase subunit 4 [Orientocreadium sp. HS]